MNFLLVHDTGGSVTDMTPIAAVSAYDRDWKDVKPMAKEMADKYMDGLVKAGAGTKAELKLVGFRSGDGSTPTLIGYWSIGSTDSEESVMVFKLPTVHVR